MIFYLLYSILLILLIFITSRKIIDNLYKILYKITGNKKTSVWILVLFLLPGTVMHELAHFLAATLVRVPTGPMSIFPKFEKNYDEKGDRLLVKTGHIMVAKTDPFRLTVIGVAPMLIGLLIIYVCGKFLIGNTGGIFERTLQINTLIASYILLIASSSMFSSGQDLKSLLITAPVIGLLLSALYYSGIKIVVEERVIERVTFILKDLNGYLLLTAAIDFGVLMTTGLGIMLFRGREKG